MKAQQLATPAPIGSRPLQAIELPSPRPGRGELLVRVTACAVCRTDLQIVEGELAARTLPIVPGHQVVGRVTALGEGVAGWVVGDRAGVGWLAETCGTCRLCVTGRENLCEAAEFTGWDRDGGYAEQVVVQADFALRMPEETPDALLAPLLCGGVIGYRALRLSGIEPGGRLGLFGFGASARLAIQVAGYWGCEVFVATRSQPEQDRALDMGAAWAGHYDDPIPVGLDSAVTFAPSGDVVVSALRSLGRGGTVAVNAIHLDRMPEFPYDLLWWERHIRSVANYTREDAREFLSLAAEIPISADVEESPLIGANRELARLKAGDARRTIVLSP